MNILFMPIKSIFNKDEKNYIYCKPPIKYTL